MVLCRLSGVREARQIPPFKKVDIGFGCVDGGRQCDPDLQFDNVEDFCGIAGRSGFSDGAGSI